MASTEGAGGRTRSRRRGTGTDTPGEASTAGQEGDAKRRPAAGRSRRAAGEAGARSASRAITNPLNAGAGILQRMQELGDHPIRDAEYLRNSDGSQVEQCWGTRGPYIASNASGNWEVAGPFGGGA